MKENKLTILIKKPIAEVFEFTTNPKNTHLWIPSIKEEVTEVYPPRFNTIYKNRGADFKWNEYKVIEYEADKKFTLSDLGGNYFVQYTYESLPLGQTEMEYFEWIKEGELADPFTQDVLERLKLIMER